MTEESKFHIHDYKFGDILISDPEKFFMFVVTVKK